MQVCGCLGFQYAVRRRKGFGHISFNNLCCFHGYAPIRGFVVFTPYAGWQGIGFMVSFTPYTITHIGGLCFVKFLVPWITKGHGSV